MGPRERFFFIKERLSFLTPVPYGTGLANGRFLFDMKVYRLKNIGKTKLLEIKRRSFGKRNEISTVVTRTLSTIKKYGEKEVMKKYEKRFGKGKYSLAVTTPEIKKAYKEVGLDYMRAAKQVIKNISKVCKAQLQSMQKKPTETEKGILVWSVWRPIEKVGLYIPGGKTMYPSSVLMTGIPAIIAGCKDVILCSPPNKNGEIPAPTLVAADLIGIQKVFKVGGAEAIAAMAYGTENIPQVYKIFGAGNAYVTEAKMRVFGDVAIDMPAGPSEIFIIADETANPTFIAADLLADAEHGEDSGCVLLTTSQEVAEKTVKQIEEQLPKLSTEKYARASLKQYGLIAIVESLNEAVSFANDYAPEHLEIMTRNPKAILSEITNAGSVFLGSWTTKSAGDYATGANHVLPTGGMAKMFAPLSLESFGKLMQVQNVASKKALARIKNTIETFGEVEQLPAHKNATRIRFEM